MENTNCFICEADASPVQTTEDFERLACPVCGEYEITKDVLNQMKQHGAIFGVPEAREWLGSHLGSGKIPRITWAVAARLLPSKE
ncbi:hypothetical protein [Pseudomonas sp. B392_1p]|uniref:hypothetical protein n=1 Tax=Pseudomonas sp. B392_1p TaxID=3457507 RepID=UPI003FD499F2